MNTPALWTIKSAAKRVKELEAQNAELLTALSALLFENSPGNFRRASELVKKAKGWE